MDVYVVYELPKKDVTVNWSSISSKTTKIIIFANSKVETVERNRLKLISAGHFCYFVNLKTGKRAPFTFLGTLKMRTWVLQAAMADEEETSGSALRQNCPRLLI